MRELSIDKLVYFLNFEPFECTYLKLKLKSKCRDIQRGERKSCLKGQLPLGYSNYFELAKFESTLFNSFAFLYCLSFHKHLSFLQM